MCCGRISCWVSPSLRSIRRTPNQLHSLQQIPTQNDMLPQQLVYKNELNREYVITLARNDENLWWWPEKIETYRRGFKCFNPLNAELNPICHFLPLLGAHHILHVSRIRVKGHFNPLNAELNPICHLWALLGAHHILHVSRIRVKGHFNPLNAELNPICHFLPLLGAHHILHVSRIRVKVFSVKVI